MVHKIDTNLDVDGKNRQTFTVILTGGQNTVLVSRLSFLAG